MERLLSIGPLNDPIERQQAPALQRIFVAINIAASIALVIFLLVLKTSPAGIVLVCGATLVILGGAGGMIALRGGRFKLAVLVASFGLVLAVSLVALTFGYPATIPFLVVMLVPVILTGLVSSVRLLIITASASGLVSLLALALRPVMAPVTRLVAPPSDLTVVAIAVFLLVLVVIAAILLLFGPALRQALLAALVREQELEQLRASLEVTVTERTASLQEALCSVEQREVQLRQTLEELRTSQETIRELSAPIIPVLPGVLVAPLIGAIDSARAAIFTTNILQMIERQHARQVIFDITGVPVVDTQVAQILIQAADAARLIGAQVMIVGIRPEVAQTLVGLGVAMDQLTAYADLQQAIAILLKGVHRHAF